MSVNAQLRESASKVVRLNERQICNITQVNNRQSTRNIVSLI